MKMKDKMPSFLRGQPNYYSELISQNTKTENEKIYDALTEVESYLNSALVNPVYDLDIEDIVQDKRISNFLKHEVAFVKSPNKPLLLELQSEEVNYLLRFKRQIEQAYPELLSRNARLTMKTNGNVQYLAPSTKEHITNFRPGTNSYNLLKYLIENGTVSKPISYPEIGKLFFPESDKADRTRIIRCVSDTITYIRKRMALKANSVDDVFEVGNGLVLRVAAKMV